MTQQKQGSAFATIITIVVIVLIARCMFCDDEPSSGPTVEEQRKPKVEHDSIAAWIMCQEFVKRNLKSPSSADFGGLLAGDWQDPATHAIHMGNGKYRCTGFVDAQNSFGAQIRNQFSLTIKYTGNDNWKLVEGPVIQ